MATAVCILAMCQLLVLSQWRKAIVETAESVLTIMLVVLLLALILALPLGKWCRCQLAVACKVVEPWLGRWREEAR